MNQIVLQPDKAAKRRKLLQEYENLAYEVSMMGEIGYKYSQIYLNKAPYRVPQQSGYEWVMECLGHKKSCYKMFRMNPDVFHSLHNLLVCDYGLESTRDMTSIESLAMFYGLLGLHKHSRKLKIGLQDQPRRSIGSSSKCCHVCAS